VKSKQVTAVSKDASGPDADSVVERKTTREEVWVGGREGLEQQEREVGIAARAHK
jgi:hypothetical protein